MRLLRKQRGFLLNPYRHAGSILARAVSMAGESSAMFRGASVVSAAVSSGGESLVLGDSATTKGAATMAGEATMVMAGAATARGAASASGEATLTANGASGAVACDAADFDGTNDSLQRASAMTGAADSKKGILSIWFKVDDLSGSGLDNDDVFIACTANSTPTFSFTINHSTDKAQVAAQRADGNVSLLAKTSSTLGTAGWYHFLAAWDLSTSTVQIYLNDATNLDAGPTTVDENVVWSGFDEYNVSLGISGGFLYDGGIAEIYCAPGQYLDISVTENRRKFITSEGTPADLGATGATPTGTDPLVYLHLDDGETANNLAINRAGNGNYTVIGALTTYATSPSD